MDIGDCRTGHVSSFDKRELLWNGRDKVFDHSDLNLLMSFAFELVGEVSNESYVDLYVDIISISPTSSKGAGLAGRRISSHEVPNYFLSAISRPFAFSQRLLFRIIPCLSDSSASLMH